MKSVCLFASYFETDSVPYYVHVYLNELKRHFTEVYFLTSKNKLLDQDTQAFQKNNTRVLFLQNKGFDFGLWYQASQKLNLLDYDQLALVNDSCILFRSLDGFVNWAAMDTADVQGMTRSEAIFPHLQSYFLLLRRKAIPLLISYFEKHKLLGPISEVIHTYEVGLSRYWAENGLTISAFIDNDGYTGEFSPYYFCVDAHLQKGIPLIKKKIVNSSYRKEELNTLARMNFNVDREHYFKRLSALNGKLIVDVDRLRSEKAKMSALEVLIYNMRRLVIRWLRPIYKLLKRA